MLIGCIALVTDSQNRLLGVDCSKGRGKILPGGKWDGGSETFKQAAIRELREETGFLGRDAKLVFQAPDGFGFHVFAFHVKVDDLDPTGYGEMVAEPVTWEELKQSKYGAYYELLEDAWESYVRAGAKS